MKKYVLYFALFGCAIPFLIRGEVTFEDELCSEAGSCPTLQCHKIGNKKVCLTEKRAQLVKSLEDISKHDAECQEKDRCPELKCRTTPGTVNKKSCMTNARYDEFKS